MKRNHQNHGKRAICFILTAVLLSGLTAGCASPTGKAEEILRPVGDFFERLLGGSADTEAVSGSGEISGTDAGGNESDSGNSAEKKSGISFSLNPQEWSSDYQDKLPEGQSLFVNQAASYYYYSVLNSEEQAIYDALWAIVQDPTSTEYRKKVYVTTDPSSDAFSDEISRAYEALIFDHPELFWFRQDSGNFHYYYSKGLDLDNRYAVMVQLTEPYQNYEQEMTAFNSAVDSFMSGIDLTQSQPMIALQIHDRLIDLVTYDDDLAASYTPDGSYDYGYSAYGALVANSRGQANTAVCDGYSYAYEYLCQQAGLTVTRVGGYAGTSTDSMEGHSWNLVCLDGEWYEVDPTWDDREIRTDTSDAQSASLFAEAEADTAFWGRVRHFMFNLTTDEISNFTPDDSYTYYSANGSYATFLGPSVHVRDSSEDAQATGDYLSYLAPVAEGTKYSYDNLIGGTASESSSAGEDPLLQVDADGDGVPDDPGYRDDDQDGYVDNWQDYTGNQ